MTLPAHSDEPAARVIPLCQLREGDSGTVHATELHCEDCELLRAMGMVERCPLRVCRSGEPFIVQVNSTRLGLTRWMTEYILVSPKAADR